eukprot:TRINITY_DN12079_c0_g1_i1.p1 TRINITY_DN12079_c0_g1~~TRINITY_DN12079_c0_g1_i1.p1  ORF type:complete len:265 (+),score=11.39 TRINITY_DN12079_c0_g1_i1:109-795(+)
MLIKFFLNAVLFGSQILNASHLPQASLSEAKIIQKLFNNSPDTPPVQRLTGSNACLWQQVNCNDNGYVIELDFYYFLADNRDYVNTIPPEISLLQSLETIDLRGNHLVGTIPEEMSELTNLTEVAFADNRLRGSVPPELSNINDMYLFNVASNSLNGTLPVEYSVWGQTAAWVWLKSNSFSGTLPIEYSVFSLADLHIFPQWDGFCVDYYAPVDLKQSVYDEYLASFC